MTELLVGTKTAGFFLGASGRPIGEDGLVMVPVVDLKVDGKRLEGVGVAPDLAVEPMDSYGPDDRQLTRGIETLMRRIKS